MEAAVKAKYLHPYTNFGFRKLLGEETNKNLLIDFLNQLLPEKHKIVELAGTQPNKSGEGAPLKVWKLIPYEKKWVITTPLEKP